MSAEPPRELPDLIPLPPPSKERNRITAYSQIVHEQWGEQPVAVVSSFAEALELSEESYTHRVRVSEEWCLPDYGWVKPEDVGYLIVKNLEGERYAVHPTEEERLATASRVLELAYAGHEGRPWPIPPRMFLFIPVEHAAELRIRCRAGSAQYRIHVISR